MFEVYCISLWEIADVVPRDKYGFSAADDNYTIEDAEDYMDFLPRDMMKQAQAMKCATAWNMTTDDVLDMAWAKFNERIMIHKAITLRKPMYTPHDFYMHNTIGSRHKPRRKR